MSFNTDTWCTPSGQLKLVKKLWTKGIALDPFYNKNSKVKARKYYDLKKKQDAYKLPWKDKTFANGPYSGKNPQRTVERCCEFAEKGFSILNLCPAAPGSVYWYEYVWGCAAAIAWLGRLAFEAPCNIYDEDGKLLYKKGEEIKGNRTEIAMVLYSSDKKEIKAFQRIWEEAGYPVSLLTKDSKIEALRAANPFEDFPKAGTEVDGLTVGAHISNTESISASLDNYVILPEIREVPLSVFHADPKDLFYAADDRRRTEALAKQIRLSNRIDPLIVVIDREGPYVLEGAHRLGALYILGVSSLPALVVKDLDNDTQSNPSVFYHGSKKLFDKFKIFKGATVSHEVAEVPIFVTDQKSFAELHTRPNGYLYTLDVDLGKVFEGEKLYTSSKYWPPAYEDLTTEGQELWNDIFEGKVFPGQVENEDEYEANQLLASVLNHNWDAIEHPSFLKWLKKHDYNSARIRGEHTGNHFAVFDPNRINILSVETMGSSLKRKLLR